MITTEAPVVDRRLVLTVMEHFLGSTDRVGFGRQFGTDDLDEGHASAENVFCFALDPIIEATLAILRTPAGEVGEELMEIAARARENAQSFSKDFVADQARRLQVNPE